MQLKNLIRSEINVGRYYNDMLICCLFLYNLLFLFQDYMFIDINPTTTKKQCVEMSNIEMSNIE